MTNIPLWFSCWAVVKALLGVLKSALLALPVMTCACLLLGRTRQRRSLGKASGLCLEISFFLIPFALAELLLTNWIDLRLLPASLGLKIAPFAPFEPIWMQGTSSVCFTLLGAIFLTIASKSFKSAPEGDGVEQMKKANSRLIAAGVLSALAAFSFFGSAMMENWPFLGYPEQMDGQKVFHVIVSYTWHKSCAALMPAGALFALVFYLRLPKGPDALEKFSEDQIISLRMGLAFALAGGAFYFLDAGFLAFGTPSIPGAGAMIKVGQYTPFFIAAISLSCWIYLFSKPRPKSVFIALLPVLLMIGRSVLRF